MASAKPPDMHNEEFWRDFLTHGDSLEAIGRRVFKRIPHEPRCRQTQVGDHSIVACVDCVHLQRNDGPAPEKEAYHGLVRQSRGADLLDGK